MRATFAIAALAGSAIAAPSYGQGSPKVVKNVHVVVETVVETVYVTEGYEVSKPTPSAIYTPIYSAPAEVTSVYVEPSSKYEVPAEPTPTPEAPKPTPPPVYEQPKPEPTPEPTPEPAPEPAPPASNTGYMAIVSEYRQKLGLKPLTQSSKLEANSLKCLQSSPGTMSHQLNAGTYGQVLAPISSMADFKHAFVGGWLCEISSLLPDCGQGASEGWNYAGQTGHAEILTSPNYSEIGCSFSDGIVGCDLA